MESKIVCSGINRGNCRSCGRPIVWLKTIHGKRMPVDAEYVQAGETLFDYGKHKSHFATCPDAEKWRVKR